MRASTFSRTSKLTSDYNNTASDTGSFKTEKSDDFSVFQSAGGGGVLPIRMVDVPPIIVETIEDKQGRLSDIVDNYCEKLQDVCVPLEITQILPQVKELKRYDIMEYEGKRFATAHRVREDVIKKYQEAIIQTLSEGLSYETPLETPITFEGKELNNLVLTAKEQSYLISIFRNYHAYVCYSKRENILMLRVDGIRG